MEFEIRCVFFRMGIDDIIEFANFAVWLKSRSSIKGKCFRQFSYVWKMYIEESAKWSVKKRKRVLEGMNIKPSILDWMSKYVGPKRIFAAILNTNCKYDDIFMYKFLMLKDIKMMKSVVKKWPEVVQCRWMNSIVNYGDADDVRNVMKVLNLSKDTIMSMLYGEITLCRYPPYVKKVKKMINGIGT